MPTYKYRVRDKFANLVTGTAAANNKEEAAKKLKILGYTPISVIEASEFRHNKFLEKFQRVRLPELHAFTRQLQSLQKAGLPFLSSLEAIAQEVKNPYFKTVIQEIAKGIKGGLSFHEALKEYPDIFDGIYVNMIKTAETAGAMPNILERLAELIDREIDTRERLQQAIRYPAIVLATLGLGFFIVVAFVIPRFAVIYSQFHTLLPLPTRILIAINAALHKFWYLFILGAGAAIFNFKRFIKSKRGRMLWDNFKLHTPVFGPLITMFVMSRFARITAILMKSGVPILEIMDLAAGTSGNVIISEAIKSIKEGIIQGKGISEPMKLSNLFPAQVIQMVSVGEQTGKIDELLLGMADYYDRESAYTVKNLSSYIEPALIFVLAAMVLGMALAIFLPMWNLIRLFKTG